MIKVYRKSLSNDEKNTIKDYAKDFIQFVENNRKVFPPDLQDRIFISKTSSIFTEIKKRIEKKIFDSVLASMGNKKKKKINDEEISEKMVNDELKDKNSLDTLPNLTAIKFEDIKQKYGDQIKKCAEQVFKEVKLEEGFVNKLIDLAVLSFLKDEFRDYTGVVIAGFGKDEIYPSYIELKIDYILENKLKYKENDFGAVDEHGPMISFFAQANIGRGFLRGVDSSLWNYSRRQMLTCLLNVRDKIVEDIMKIKRTKKKKEVSDKIDTVIRDNYGLMLADIDSYIDNNTVSDIVETTKSLPKDELAAMAETLVNLTSFKKRVSGEEETVGGPIDVAVISKGDGFVWIKRKHYFDSKYNPHFMENYFRGEQGGN